MKKLFALLLLFTTFTLWGQDRCGTDAILEQQLQDPKFARSFAKLEKKAQDLQKSRSSMPDLPITIPTIVHIIHLGDPYGVGDHFTTEWVEDAIDNLNANFAGDFSSDPTSNTQINFCIANLSTTGNPIEGIQYHTWDEIANEIGVSTTFSNNNFYNNNLAVSNAIGYDRINYCNIFIAPFTSPLGFAYLSPSITGIFVSSNYFGVTGGNYGQNRTLVHEAGHYLGLFHTFHFTSSCGSETNCVSQGDKVCDTPPTTGNVGCPGNGGVCGNDSINNYMDYTYDTCMDSFTQGQILRMLAMLDGRPGILANDLACGAVAGIDAAVTGITVPDVGCSPILSGVTYELQNFGDTLTETTINYTVNGEQDFIIWTGNLGFGESEIITLPDFNVGFGLVDIEIEVDALDDIYVDNNITTYQFDNYEGTYVDIIVEWDALPYGIDIELFEADSSNNPIGEAIFLYENEDNNLSCTVDTFDFCLPEGNYIVEVNDLFGNGMSYPCQFVDRCIWVEVNGEIASDPLCGGWSNNDNIPFIVGPPGCSPATCYGDVDGDGFIWTSDILVMLQYFGLEVEPCSPFDTDQDGIVGVNDIMDVLAAFDTDCSGQLAPEDGFEIFLRNEQEGELVKTVLYNLMGQEIQNTDHLDTGIYVIVQEWNVPNVGPVVTRKKIFRE